MVVFVKYRRSESKCFKRSYVFADCNGCVLLRTQGKIEKRYCISLRTAMIVLLSVGDLKVNVSKGRMSLRTAGTKTTENLKAILYVFADCNGCVC